MVRVVRTYGEINACGINTLAECPVSKVLGTIGSVLTPALENRRINGLVDALLGPVWEQAGGRTNRAEVSPAHSHNPVCAIHELTIRVRDPRAKHVPLHINLFAERKTVERRLAHQPA